MFRRTASTIRPGDEFPGREARASRVFLLFHCRHVSFRGDGGLRSAGFLFHLFEPFFFLFLLFGQVFLAFLEFIIGFDHQPLLSGETSHFRRFRMVRLNVYKIDVRYKRKEQKQDSVKLRTAGTSVPRQSRFSGGPGAARRLLPRMIPEFRRLVRRISRSFRRLPR